MRGRNRRGALGLAALAVLLAACTPPPPVEPLPPDPAPDGLRVMTWNLLGAQADASVFSEHAGWAARVDQLRPDVLVVQEAQSDDVSALAQLPQTDYVVAAHLEWECDLKPLREGVAVLVRADLDLLGAGGRHLGTSCVDPTMRRVLVWADVQVGDAPLRVYGTHLTAGGGAAAGSRRAQIRELRQHIAAEDPDRTRRWVLAGDLNVVPDGAEFQLVTRGEPADSAGVFADAQAVVRPEAVDPSTCPSVAEGDTEAMEGLLADSGLVRRCGYSGGWPKDDNWIGCDLLSLCTSWEQRRDLSVRIRIDHVMTAAEGPLDVLDVRVPNRSDADWSAPGAEWFRLSDHLPVVVDLAVA